MRRWPRRYSAGTARNSGKASVRLEKRESVGWSPDLTNPGRASCVKRQATAMVMSAWSGRAPKSQADRAETEIRVFETDFSLDGPVYRYKVDFMVARASKSPRLMREDRATILEEGRDLALMGMNRFALNKSLLTAYAELGLEYYRIVGTYEVFDDAMRSGLAIPTSAEPSHGLRGVSKASRRKPRLTKVSSQNEKAQPVKAAGP
jgi:hypothetical protein